MLATDKIGQQGEGLSPCPGSTNAMYCLHWHSRGEQSHNERNRSEGQDLRGSSFEFCILIYLFYRNTDQTMGHSHTFLLLLF